MSVLQHRDWERYIVTTAKRADMSVVWEDKGFPRTNGKRMVLPRFHSGTTEQQYNELRHAVAHEVEHVLYSDFTQLTAKGLNAQSSFLGTIWNGLEDVRVERLGSSEYEGDRMCHNEVVPLLCKEALSSIKTLPQEVQDKLLPFLAWMNKQRAETLPSCHLVQKEVESKLSPKGKELLSKMDKHPTYADVLRNAAAIADAHKGTAATYELAKRIFEEVFGGDAKKEEERCKKEQQEGGGKKKGEENGEGAGAGEGEGSGGGGGEEKGAGAEGEAEGKEERTLYGKYMPDSHECKPNRSLRGIHYTNLKSSREAYIPPNEGEIEITDYSKDKNGGFDGGYGRLIGEALAHSGPSFAHQVRTILQVRARDRYEYGTKRGKLNMHQLHRVPVNKPGYSERVFKKKQVSTVLDAAVSLVIDQSGSMSGTKFAHAAAAAILLSDVIGNVLHVPTEIVGFSANYTLEHRAKRGTVMTIHRNFSDRLLSRDDLAGRFIKASRHMCNNLDGEAVLWSFDRLMQRREKRKLMVVFSDGQPAGSPIHGGDGCWYLKQVVSSIERLSPVDIVGIGIEDDSVQNYYSTNFVINKASELEQTLLSLVEQRLK